MCTRRWHNTHLLLSIVIVNSSTRRFCQVRCLQVEMEQVPDADSEWIPPGSPRRAWRKEIYHHSVSDHLAHQLDVTNHTTVRSTCVKLSRLVAVARQYAYIRHGIHSDFFKWVSVRFSPIFRVALRLVQLRSLTLDSLLLSVRLPSIIRDRVLDF